MAEASLRLDKFLWFVRLAKTRSFAQATAEAGHVRIDGRPVDRAHAAVRIGNVLSFPLHDRVRIIRVEALPPRRGPAAEARLCYTDLDAPQGLENGSQTGPDIDAPEHAT
jgi:ribosome-associated heat shock protein Hsp15